jgi:hypothetical protein
MKPAKHDPEIRSQHPHMPMSGRCLVDGSAVCGFAGEASGKLNLLACDPTCQVDYCPVVGDTNFNAHLPQALRVLALFADVSTHIQARMIVSAMAVRCLC